MIAPALALALLATAECSNCHSEVAEWKKKKAVHAPVAASQCSGCHNPHASKHAGLLRGAGTRICLGCHEQIAAKLAAGMPHGAIASETGCLSCHDPHASERPNLLVGEGPAELCGRCHEGAVKEAGLPQPHPPVRAGGCQSCHDPHASPHRRLGRKEEPALCVTCHAAAGAAMSAAHRRIPLAGARCTSCHTPHGSEKPGLLHALAHAPFAEGACDACHASGKPEAACGACHEQRTGGHPLPPGATCTSCHAPHASPAAGLIRETEMSTCLGCHTDVRAARERAAAFHPAAGGKRDCTVCHQLHTGSSPALLKKEDAQRTCVSCHSGHSQFSHPMGPGVEDRSRPGRPVECLSCHDPHGTAYPQFLLGDPRAELCTRCHEAG
jgi:predicted CXXCH cytochrome family protein